MIASLPLLILVNKLPSYVLIANSPRAKLAVDGTAFAVELRFNKI